MRKKKSPKDLPQTKDGWYLAIRKLESWIKNDQDKIIRPMVMIVLNLDKGFVHNFKLEQDYDENKVKEFLFSTMTDPIKEFKIKPQRPAQVTFEELALSNVLAEDLQQLGIECLHNPQPQMVDEVLGELTSFMERDQPQIPGLLSVKKTNPSMIGSLFKAAADFYLAAPWVQLSNYDVLEIRVPPQKEPYYVIVMGQGGMEYGLSLYKEWKDLERWMSNRDQPDRMIPPSGMHSFTFEEMYNLPFDDLNAIETYGWDIANEQAFPFPIIYKRNKKVERPDWKTLLWYEAALRAITILVEKHLEPNEENEIGEIEVVIPVNNAAGEVEVQIKSAAKEAQTLWSMSDTIDYYEDDIEPPFDRRVMEGDIFNMFDTVTNMAPEVIEAQELMYEAWEEKNPAKRIAKAHQALKVSPDCADAYVLLAEEQASTLQEAFSLYQSGVEAGERALGEDYFEENEGDFWGLLETRPYMRSLEGLANCLWQLGKKEEAIDHYYRLLTLNPGDNQGIRYVLVDLLLATNRIHDLLELIKAYDGDGSAVWWYTKALLAYREKGDQPASRRVLKKAWEANSYVLDYLTGKKRIPSQKLYYIGRGDDNEAIDYASHHLNYWRKTQGAVKWLEKALLKPVAQKDRKRRGKEKTSASPPKPSQFQIGDSVQVKQGVHDPDYGNDLSGWQGRVIQISEDDSGLVLIGWDSITLNHIPGKEIDRCESEGLSWSTMYLSEDEIIPATARDTVDNCQAAMGEIAEAHKWAHLGKQGTRIKAIVGELEADDEIGAFEAWQRFLERRLKFPFEAEVAEPQESETFKTGDRVKVTGLLEINKEDGVMVAVEAAGNKGAIPLYDLELYNRRSQNYQVVDDYLMWISNF